MANLKIDLSTLKQTVLKYQLVCDGFYYNIYQCIHLGYDKVFYVCSSKKLAKDINLEYHDLTFLNGIGGFVENFTNSPSESVSRITNVDALYTNGKDIIVYSGVNIENNVPGKYSIKINTGTLQCPEKEIVTYDFKTEPVLTFKVNFSTLLIFKLKHNMIVI